MVSVSQQKLRTRNKEAKKKQNKTKQKKQKIKSKKLRSWVSKKTRISKRHTEKQTSQSVKTSQNGFFIAVPTFGCCGLKYYSSYSVIVRVSVVLKRTVVGD